MATGPNARPLRGTPMSILEIADLKKLAKRRVPKMFFDYADSGAWTESTYRANEEDFAEDQARQRVLVDMSNRSLETTMIGEKVSMPVALAPTGMTGMQHPDGEILAAQAAEEFGVPFTLSTMSICSIEDVAENTNEAVLVPALRAQRQGFRLQSDRPRQGGEMLGAGADARPADPRPAPQGPAQRALRAAEIHAQAHLAGGDAAALGVRHARHASAAPSATSSATPRASATSPRCRPGRPSSSTRICPGRMSSGSRSAGAAS